LLLTPNKIWKFFQKLSQQKIIIFKENKKKYLYFVHISEWLTTNYRIPLVGGGGDTARNNKICSI
jgi:hypothetical protein